VSTGSAFRPASADGPPAGPEPFGREDSSGPDGPSGQAGPADPDGSDTDATD
jgi:hypothetical protein